MEPKIIKETDDHLILSKPSGWITNSASTTGNTPVLQEWIKDNLDFDISKNDKLRSGIVHRIDKETSGIIIIAKNEKSFRYLQKQFKERKVKKTYLTLVHGQLEPKEGSVNVPIGRLPWNRERFGVFPGGKMAKSRYKVVTYDRKEDNKYSLVEVYPKTGRTHQIRVHMKYLKHPIVADEFYAGRKTSRRDRRWCPRLFLHAHGISFIDPSDQKRVRISSKLSDDLDSVLDQLHKL